MTGGWRAALLVVGAAACRQENPDWMGPADPSIGGQASTSGGEATTTPGTSGPAATTNASGDGSGSSSGAPMCEPNTQLLCSGTCKNILEDRKNCGACGNMCTGGEQCIDGVCG